MLRVALFGATGMVGQGALRECLAAQQVGSVLSVARRPSGTTHDKLREVVHQDFADFSAISSQLQACNTCLWCIGVTSSGLNEAEYTKITHDHTLAAAKVMVHPGMTFVYVSAEGADSSGTSRTMWARVKGKTENDLMAMPFKAVYVFRPNIVQPMHGVESRTKSYRIAYKVIGPLMPLVKAVAPNHVTTTQYMGRAMLQCALAGSPTQICTAKEMNALAEQYVAMHGEPAS